MALLTSGNELIALVKNKEVAVTTAIALVREHGASAGRVAKTGLEKVKAAGKKKLTKAAAMTQFSAKQSRQLVELLAKHCQVEQDEEGVRVTLTLESDLQVAELMDIIQAAREHYGDYIARR